ncbi:MAG: alpha/beta fold hydrolase [Verrucomicrobiota bacterium]
MGLPLPYLEFGAARGEADLCILLMHGLGADGHDFAGVAEAWTQAAASRKWRFVLPHAPVQAVTVNMGVRMPSWYDILSFSEPREVDWESVKASRQSIEGLIDEEAPDRLVLAGFSQGAAMALHVGLRRQTKTEGVLMMSGYLLESETERCPEKVDDLTIGIFHGSEDPVVPLEASGRTETRLKEKGFVPSLKVYQGMEHAVCDDEVDDVFRWLVGVSDKRGGFSS